ncbi:MAG TPA: hypothetical protein VNT75_25085 [Symbiobacteriaceae bacterium]|nr:hypothetical protein [Symbiobacteriaceae bacterium]
MASLQAEVRKVVTPRLAPYGFSYSGMPEKSSWQFSREENGIRLDIVFVKSHHVEHAIRVEFRSSEELVGLEAYHLMGGSRPEDGWWHYTGDTLASTLDELADIAVRYGLPYLATLSRPVLMPPPDVARTLVTNPAGFAMEFCKASRIESVSADLLDQVDKYVLQAAWEETSKNWDLMLGVAAYFGEALRGALGGEWSWHEGFKAPVLADVGGKVQRVYPLLSVARFWARRSDSTSLRTTFANISAMVHR